MTASFLATATLAFLKPIRFTSLRPQALSLHQWGTRVSNPDVMRAPYDGVVDTIHVQPNQAVVQGQLLFELDSTALTSKLKIAEKILATVRVEHEQVMQKALFDPKAKDRLEILKGRTEEKVAEVEYYRSLLQRIRVKARSSGVVVVDDPSEWAGRPVAIGERVMSVAEEMDVEVEAWLSVGDAIELPSGSAVTVFLNASPLESIQASVRYAAYRAIERPDGTLAYRIRATLATRKNVPRLGLKGTARIDTGSVPAIYWVFRRPFATIRQFLGL